MFTQDQPIVLTKSAISWAAYTECLAEEKRV